MRKLDPNEMSSRDHYKFLTGSIIPRPIAFVTTQSEQGVLNAAPFSFFNVVSTSPPLISISIQRSTSGMKDTARNAMYKKEFVVHISDESYIQKINMTATNAASDVSEVELAGLTPVESKKITVPGVTEANIRMECTLERAIPLGDTDNQGPTCDLLIGRVVQYHIRDELYQNGKIDSDALKPISRLAGNDYAKLGEIVTMIRPT